MTLIVRDDQSRGEQARTIVEQLITVNKVHWLNGEGTSGITSIIQPVVESYGAPDDAVTPAPRRRSPRRASSGSIAPGPTTSTMVASVFSVPQGVAGQRRALRPQDHRALHLRQPLLPGQPQDRAASWRPRPATRSWPTSPRRPAPPRWPPRCSGCRRPTPDVLFIVQYPAETTVFQNDAKRAGLHAEGDRHQQRRLLRPDVAASAEDDQRRRRLARARSDGHRPRCKKPSSWKKVNEIYKKYSRGQNMGELAMREITGLLWMADIDQPREVGGAGGAGQGGQRDQHGRPSS